MINDTIHLISGSNLSSLRHQPGPAVASCCTNPLALGKAEPRHGPARCSSYLTPVFPPFFLSGGSGSTTRWEDPQHTHPADPSNLLQILL